MIKMNRIAPLFVIVAAALWGIDGIILRPALYGLPVPVVVFVESILITILLIPVLIRHRSELSALKRNDWLAFIGVAIFGGVIGTMSITRALFFVNYVNLSVVVLIQKLQPVIAILFAAIMLKEKPSKRFFLWAGLAVVGAYLMTFGVHSPDFAGEKTLEAALFSLLAVIGFGSSTVFSKRALRNVSYELGTFLRFALTALVMCFVVVVTQNISNIFSINSSQTHIFLLIALTTGGPAIFLYYYGLKKISASVATICELAFPLTAVILEYIIRKNLLDPIQIVGVAILLYSIFRVTRVKMVTVSS